MSGVVSRLTWGGGGGGGGGGRRKHQTAKEEGEIGVDALKIGMPLNQFVIRLWQV